MERNIKIDAITLKKLKIGESNIGVTLLTSDDRVLFVMTFGAAKSKSKFFGAVNPFVIGEWDLYYDPVKELWRGKEVSVKDFNNELAMDIESFYTGSLLSEIILKSQGSEGVFSLYRIALSLLKQKGRHIEVLSQFILRLLDRQGLLPSFNYCSSCGTDISKDSLIYTGHEELFCFNCCSGPKIYTLNPGILQYCQKTPTMDMELAIKIGLEKDAKTELKKYLIEIIKLYTGGKLLTLNSSNGLI